MSDLPYQALREDCCRVNRRLPELGIVDLTFGNVSVADRAQNVMAIKPSGVPYASLQPEDCVVLDLRAQPDAKGQLDFDDYRCAGKLRPSSDTPTHLLLYQRFAHIGAVVHTHSRHATAFAQAGREIPCLGTTHADYFYGPVPVTRDMSPEEIHRHYEWQTGEVIAELFEQYNPEEIGAVLVKGHAPFVWGPTGEKAVEIAFALEVIAEMAWKALSLNPQAAPLNDVLHRKHYFRKHGQSAYYGQK